MKKAFAYIRVSTVGQAEEGFSLDHQKQAIQDYARTRSMHLSRIYVDEGKSGRTVNRPEFQQMLKDIAGETIECVIIYKIDRFARNVADFTRICNEFKQKQINLISVLEGDLLAGSSLIPNIFASVAQWESEVNSQRTKDALMEKFKTGWQPTPPPLGYRSVGGDGERKYCELDPNIAPIIKTLFELYSTGEYSMLSLQEWLRDKNIISKNGTVIGHSVINNILNNPFYYGLIRWHGQAKTGKHTPLISKQLFDACNYLLQKHRHFLIRERKHNFLLRGFGYCSCGTRLIGDYHKIKSNGRIIGYYHCQKRYSVGCKEPYIQAVELERQIEEKMKQIQLSTELVNKIVEKAKEYVSRGKDDTQGMKQALINQVSGLVSKRNKLEDLLINEDIDKETYKRKHTQLNEQIHALEQHVHELEAEATIDVPLIEKVLKLSTNIYEAYKQADIGLKRHYLRFFYERFVVVGKTIFEAKPTPLFALMHGNNLVTGDSLKTDTIIQTLGNSAWMEQAKERLKQIVQLTKGKSMEESELYQVSSSQG